MMQVTIKLFASLRIGRFTQQQRYYTMLVTPQEIAQELEIPLKDLGVVLRNGNQIPLDSPLQEGDILAFMPRISGG